MVKYSQTFASVSATALSSVAFWLLRLESFSLFTAMITAIKGVYQFMKRFTRSGENRILAGVCGGIGNYFHIDPRIIRLVFLVLLVTPLGWGMALLYLLLALTTPRGLTPFEAQFQRQADWLHRFQQQSDTIFQQQSQHSQHHYRPNTIREAEHVDDEEDPS